MANTDPAAGDPSTHMVRATDVHLTLESAAGAQPDGARITLFADRYSRYSGPLADQVVPRYVEIANRHGIDPVHLAIAFVLSRPFVTAAIIGASGRFFVA